MIAGVPSLLQRYVEILYYTYLYSIYTRHYKTHQNDPLLCATSPYATRRSRGPGFHLPAAPWESHMASAKCAICGLKVNKSKESKGSAVTKGTYRLL